MLAELLEGARARLLRPADEAAADDERRALLDELIERLRRGRGDERPQPRRAATATARELRARARLREDVVAEVERLGATVPLAELLIVSEWSSAVEHERVREENRRLLSLLDAVDDVVMLIGPDERLLYANRRALRTLEALQGRPIGCVAGKGLVELGLPVEQVARWRWPEISRRAFAGETLTTEILGRAGGRWRENILSPVYESDGTVSAVAVVGRDVHARKLVERRLALLARVSMLVGLRRDELLQSIARLSIPELADWSGVDILDGARVYRTFLAQRDPAKAAMRDEFLRYEPRIPERLRPDLEAGRPVLLAEVREEDLRDRTPEDHPELLAPYKLVGALSCILVPILASGRLAAILFFVTTEESGRRYGHDDVVLAEELARRAAQIIENEKLHEELRLSEGRFRIALSASKHVVFEQDRALRYRWYYNASVSTDVVGKRHEDLFPPAEAEHLTRIKQRVLDGGKRMTEEVQLSLFSGERAWYRLVLDPVRDADGDVVGLIGAASDISNDKRMQEALAQGVTFRERMMSVLGHDLRNPLNAIATAAALLCARTDVPDRARAHAAMIDQAARRMKELIATLLDFAHARFRGQLPITPAVADLAAIAREAVDELRSVRPERAIELSVHGDAHGHWDPGRMAQVVSNLVANALDHGADGAPVEVAVRDEGERVSFSVHNEGAPIPPQLMRVLFEPFTRAVDEPRARGLGLGLYIADQIVAAHGGAIEVSSTRDDGTSFTVRLPRLRAHDAAASGAR
jgi:signal transduction histidine kinase/GAF domain-containing protein